MIMEILISTENAYAGCHHLFGLATYQLVMTIM